MTCDQSLDSSDAICECVNSLPPPSPPSAPSIDFQVTVGGGSYPSEVSWDLTCSGALIGSGGAPYSGTLSAPPGECTLDMYDSYGDGWNGDLWKGAGYTFTLGSGSYGSETFILAPLPPSSPSPPSLPPPAPPPP